MSLAYQQHDSTHSKVPTQRSVGYKRLEASVSVIEDSTRRAPAIYM